MFEFNDEPNKNGYNKPDPDPETNRGIFKYYTTKNPFDFRKGTIQTTINTGVTPIPW